MMNGIRGLAITAAVAAVVAVGIAGGAEATKQHFRFELLDGTVTTGTMDAAALTVKTSYGTLKVPAADLVSFSPGLDSRPELAEKVDVLIRLLVSPEKEDREQAQAELIKLGPALRGVGPPRPIETPPRDPHVLGPPAPHPAEEVPICGRK